MNKEDLLFEYFEGGLDFEQEENLFSQLQYDNSMREEFNQQMKLLLLARQDSSTISAPLESTESIFKELGINKHYYFAARRREKFIKYVGSSSFKRNIALVSISIILFFSSLMIYENSNKFFGLGTKGSNEDSRNSYPTVTSKEISDKSAFSNSQDLFQHNINQNSSYLTNTALNAIGINRIEDAIMTRNSQNFKKLKSIYSKRENALLAQITELHSKLNENSMIISSNVNYDKSTNFIKSLDDVADFNKKQDFGHNKFEEYYAFNRARQFSKPTTRLSSPDIMSIESGLQNLLPKDYKYEISLRTNTQKSTTPVLNSNFDKSKVENFEFSAGYHLNPIHQLGFVIGRDNFPQSFAHSIDGQQFIQVQNPTLYYYGGFYKISPQNLFNQNLLLPYLFAFGGGTSIGPFFKGQAGFELGLFDRLSLIAGIENSILIYNVENKIYSTNKINFVYGLNVKF